MPINRKLDVGYYAIFVVGVVVFVTTVIAVWQQFCRFRTATHGTAQSASTCEHCRTHRKHLLSSITNIACSYHGSFSSPERPLFRWT